MIKLNGNLFAQNYINSLFSGSELKDLENSVNPLTDDPFFMLCISSKICNEIFLEFSSADKKKFN